MTMNVFTTIISLLTAAFGFATALLEYLKTSRAARRAEKTANGQPAVSSDEDAAANTSLRNPFRG
ncbi:hypothetical protein [Paenibacillus xanthanilyticus]|uniref:Uncharacterized protein n=1 Tax=Paenibacillus xanthanilyticus TaxID=1783531 RepID=A0ABV8JW56_9BACL